MRIATNYIYDSSEYELTQQYERISELQTELSTGVLVSSADKNPVAMASINILQSKLDSMAQTGKNAASARVELQTEHTQLSSYETIVQKIRSIINEAGNSGGTADDIKNKGKQLQQYLQEIVAIANTKNHDGKSIFAGTAADTDAYHVEKNDDGTITNVTYQGNDNTQKITLESGVSVDIYQSGDHVFGKGADSIFHTLINLSNRLSSGKQLTSDEVKTELGKIKVFQDSNSSNLTKVEDSYGLASFEDQMHESLTSNYKGMLSNLRDADIAHTTTELSKYMTFLKATMTASVQVEKLSIFNQD